MQTIQQENAEKEIVLANLIRVRTTANIVHLRDIRSTTSKYTAHLYTFILVAIFLHFFTPLKCLTKC